MSKKYYSCLKAIIQKKTSPLHRLWIYIKFGKNVIIDSSATISPKAIIEAEYGGSISIANCEVNEFVIIKSYGGNIKIEENCFIGPFCVLYGHGGLSIGKQVGIAAHCGKKGYRLIGVNKYEFNAFFMRNDIASDLFPEIEVSSCFSHAQSRDGMEKRYPNIKNFEWIEV